MLKFQDDADLHNMAKGIYPHALATRPYKEGEKFDLNSLMYGAEVDGEASNIPLQLIDSKKADKIIRDIQTFQSVFGN